MEAIVYMLLFFWGNSLQLPEDIHEVWRGCLVLFLRYDFLKSYEKLNQLVGPLIKTPATYQEYASYKNLGGCEFGGF